MPTSDPSPNRQPAGRGERIAIGGYKPQYDAAICFTLRALRNRWLQEIRLADLEAGRVDDLLLIGANVIHGYQMKAEAGDLAFADLTSADGLLFQLADGWARLRVMFPGRDVRVHLVTDQALSTSTHGNVRIPFGPLRPPNANFEGFWRHVWLPYQQSLRHPASNFVISAEWQPAFDAWRAATRLGDDFPAFALAAVLEPFPSSDEREAIAPGDDYSRLYALLQERIADQRASTNSIRVTRGELETLLGAQFELCNPQSFPVSRLYLPLSATIDSLGVALTTFSRGYLAVLGPPGSGKSSLLTRTLVETSRPDRIVRYYCFVPDEGYGGPARGEAASFLSDLVVQIEEYGFQAGLGTPKRDLDDVRRRFGEQLHLLHRDYQQSGIKTVIVVDGLDHVALDVDGRLRHPLLAELPQPHQVPEGVLFVLSGQHLNGVVSTIQSHLTAEPQRSISMTQFGLEDVVEFLQRSDLWEPLGRTAYEYESDPRAHRVATIYRLSEGHPLALEYIRQSLADALAREEDIDGHLNQILPYDGNIHHHYNHYWQQLEASERDDFVEVAGLLARQRGALDFTWMRTWNGNLVVNRFQQKFAHFFRRGRAHHWHFFHDSFRQFLRAKSMGTLEGPDPEIDRRFHRRLADLCASAPESSTHQWDTTYHLWHGAAFEEVCLAATVEAFEAQLHALRPPPDVVADARIGVQAAAALQDPVRLFRALLILAEFEQREYSLGRDEDELVPLLVAMDRIDVALAWTLADNQLRPDRTAASIDRRTDALRLCRELAGVDAVEAERLFNLAEPLHLLRRGLPFPRHDGGAAVGVLKAWADVAAWHRPVQDVIASIRRLRWEPDQGEPDDPYADENHQNSLLAQVASSLMLAHWWEDVDAVIAAFDHSHIDGIFWKFWRLVYAHDAARQAGDNEESERYLDRLLTEIPPGRLLEEEGRQEELARGLREEYGPDGIRVTPGAAAREAERRLSDLRATRIGYAALLYRVRQDVENAVRLTADIAWFPPADVAHCLDTITKVDDPLMQLCALRTALTGVRPDPTALVPDTLHASRQPLVLVARTMLRLAALSGERWREEPPDPHRFRVEAAAMLRFHMMGGQGGERAGPWSITRVVLVALADALLIEAEWRGAEVVRALQEELENIWSRPGNLAAWPVWTRRRILARWLHVTEHQAWAEAKLRQLLAEAPPDDEVNEQVAEAVERVMLSLQLGDASLARHWISQVVAVSLGVGQEKDYQFIAWLRWGMRRNMIDAVGTAERVEHWVHRTLAYSRAGGYGNAAASILLREVFNWSPVRAVHLFGFLFDENCLDYDNTIQEWVFATLKSDGPAAQSVALSVFRSFVLPLMDRSDRETSVRAVLGLSAHHGGEMLLTHAASIWDAAQTACAPRVRYVVARDIDVVLQNQGHSAAAIGISPEDLVAPTPDTSRNNTDYTLTLRSGERQTLAQVCEQVRDDYTCVARLRAEEYREPGTYFNMDWSRVVKDVALQLPSVEAIHALAVVASDGSYAALALAALAERAQALENRGLARVLGEQSLAYSNEHGWVNQYDSGTRRAAFAALVAVDSGQYRPQAFVQFGRDIAFNSGKVMAEGFMELLSIFGGDATLGALGDVAEAYVERLLSSITVAGERLDFLHDAPVVADNPAFALVLLALTELLYPGHTVIRRALRTLAQMTIDLPDTALPVLEFGLKQDELLQERTLMVCEAVALSDHEAIRALRPALRLCTSSSHFAVAETARRILRRLGEAEEPSQSIVLVPTANILSPPASESDLNPDRRRMYRTLHLFSDALNYIARKTDVPMEVLLLRAERLMVHHGGIPPEADKADEKTQRNVMPYYFTYTNARARAARKAVNYLIGQMLESGELRRDAIIPLQRMIGAADPHLVWWQKSSRPIDVPILRSYSYQEHPEENIEEDYQVVLPERDQQGRVILGETAKFWSGDDWWEERSGCVAFADPLNVPNGFELEHIFNCRPGITVEHYPHVRMMKDDLPFACMDTLPHWFDTPCGNWIALFPPLAYTLGWNPHPSKPFTWTNAEGTTQVETIGWEEGTSMPRYPDPNFGWRVVATPDAWRRITENDSRRAIRFLVVSRGREHCVEPTRVRSWVASIMDR